MKTKQGKPQGQGLVEYLILVCLIAVTAIGVVSVVGKNIREQYANVHHALNGRGEQKLSAPGKGALEDRRMDDFLESAKKE